jgi:hypothetical protein
MLACAAAAHLACERMCHSVQRNTLTRDTTAQSKAVTNPSTVDYAELSTPYDPQHVQAAARC